VLQGSGEGVIFPFKSLKIEGSGNRLNRHSVAAGVFLSGCLVALIFAVPHSRILAAPDATFTVESLTSPAGANSSEPQITVQGDRLILSWLEVGTEKTTLKYAERTASGWTVPQSVYSSDSFFVNAFDVPSVRALSDGMIAAHWTESLGDESDASRVRVSWSKDRGHTWSRPASPHHDGTKTEHGFVSLFQTPGVAAASAGFGLVWIDGRLTDPEKETGDMSLRATTYDVAGKQMLEKIVVPRICECCATASADTSEGVIVAFRNRTKDEIRDIYVERLVAGHWSAPTVVHDDDWKITACPINGPAISANGREVAVAWYTAKDDQGKAFVAFSHDAGHTFGAPIRVDDSTSLGRLGVQILADGSAAVTYNEFANKHSQFRVRKIFPTGVRSAAVTVAETSSGRYPRVARDRNELLFSWTDGEGTATKVLTARASLDSK
jgi:hypothetical protein